MSLVLRKPVFCICEKQRHRSVTAKLISAFVFATRIVHSIYLLNPKFQASRHILWLYSPVCVGPCRKPRRPVFSQRGSIIVILGFNKAVDPKTDTNQNRVQMSLVVRKPVFGVSDQVPHKPGSTTTQDG